MGFPVAAAVAIGGGLIHGSSAGTEVNTMQQWYNEALNGSQGSVNLLLTKAGYAGGSGIAATEQGKVAAQDALDRLAAAGAIQGFPVPHPPGVPNLIGTVRTTPGFVGSNYGPAAIKATAPSSGIVDTLKNVVDQISAPATERAGAAAGQQAASQLKGSLYVIAAVVAVALVASAVILSRRRR